MSLFYPLQIVQFSGIKDIQIATITTIHVQSFFIFLKWNSARLHLKQSLAVQWCRLCAPNAGGSGLIPSWETKILHAAWRSKKKKTKKNTQWLPSHPLPSPWQPPFSFLFLWIWQVSVPRTNGSKQQLSLCVWLASLSVMFSRFIHVVARVRITLLFKAESYSIVWVDHILLIHLSWVPPPPLGYCE